MIMDNILVIAALAIVATGTAIDGVRKLRLNNSVLGDSLLDWQKRHRDQALAAAQIEGALSDLMVGRLGYDRQGAQAAINMWRKNGWSKAKIGDTPIDQFKS